MDINNLAEAIVDSWDLKTLMCVAIEGQMEYLQGLNEDELKEEADNIGYIDIS